jgi:predicted dinucleotide-utilizing enzyme
LGLVGLGRIGAHVYELVTQRPELGLDVAFAFDVDPDRLGIVRDGHVLGSLDDLTKRGADMICEFAHADFTRDHGRRILAHSDYFMVSVTALADADLGRELEETARRNGTRLFVPHGGAMGLDTIREGRDSWDEVRFVMKKHPDNLDFSRSGVDPAAITGPTTLYEGPTRALCPLYPRNVNTHAAVAAAGIGFDRTQSVLIADPSLDVAVQEVYASGGGVELDFRRTSKMKGVTGVAALRSVASSVCSTAHLGGGLHFR